MAPQHAKLVGRRACEVDEGFDRAWRRVGLALDRVGFTVEDRDRVQGVYFVRYVDPDAGRQARLPEEAVQLRRRRRQGQGSAALPHRWSRAEQGASVSQVTVQNNDGKPEASPTGAKILKLLNDELK